jgi:hypothetical protein
MSKRRDAGGAETVEKREAPLEEFLKAFKIWPFADSGEDKEPKP